MSKLRPPAHPENFRVKVGRYGDRWYLDNLPDDGNWDPMTDPVPSVTAIKGSWPKFLTNWAAKEVATFAVDNLDSWQNLDRAAAVDLLSKAHNRSRDASAARGTSIHAAIEGLADHGQIPMMELVGLDEYHGILEQLANDLQPEFIASEVVAIKRGEDGYGGTPDAIATLRGHGTRVIDWKSRKPGKGGTAYPDEFCQGEAYRSADYLIVAGDDGDAVRVEVPPTDGVAVVTIEPEAYCVCVPDDDQRLQESWVALRRFWNFQKLTPVKSVRATQQIAAADQPQPNTLPVGVEAAVETQTTAGPSPDPDRLAWFTARYDEVRDAAGPAAIKAAWPEGLSSPKHRDKWTADQLERACQTIQRLHHRQGLSFPPPDPAVAKLRRKPRTTRTEADQSDIDALLASFKALPQDNQTRVTAWQAQGNHAGRGWEIRPANGVTRWAVKVNAAAIGVARHTADDDIARAWIALVIGEDDVQTHPVGALLGSLSVTEAERLAELAELDTFAAAIDTVDAAA